MFIRNIIARIQMSVIADNTNGRYLLNTWDGGFASIREGSGYMWEFTPTGWSNLDSQELYLNANTNNTAYTNSNPISGHAGGTEIKPFTILSIPIYVY